MSLLSSSVSSQSFKSKRFHEFPISDHGLEIGQPPIVPINPAITKATIERHLKGDLRGHLLSHVSIEAPRTEMSLPAWAP